MTARTDSGPALNLYGDGSGRLHPPYPTQWCVGIGCGRRLRDVHAAYLFTDGDDGVPGNFAVLCDDCALDLRLAHAHGEPSAWRLVLAL